MKVYGIFGYPLGHTLSPFMQNAAFKALGINAVYIPFEVRPEKLRNAVEFLKRFGFSGVNITIPHKEKVIDFLDKIDPLAKKIGSVNTVKNINGKLFGFNTDGIGFIRDLKNSGFNPKGKTALVIGSGGAGKAVAASLSWSGAKKVFVTDKNDRLSKALSKKIKNGRYLPFESWKQKLDDSDLLVNATPMGMKNEDPKIVEPKYFKKGLFIYDVVYNRETKLVKDAKTAGLEAMNGLGMLLYQGTAAFEIWTGKKAPVKVMEKALKNALNS